MLDASRDIIVTGGTAINIQGNMCSASHNGPWYQLLRRVAAKAIHDSNELVRHGTCQKRTREAVLKLLNDHLSSRTLESPDLLWLNGPAGAGKSAIARTIAHSSCEAGTLLASFFFCNSDTSRNTINSLVPTLAAQICRKFRQVRPHIEEAIEDDPFIFTKSTSAQADALLAHPLTQALGEIPYLQSAMLSIVVDGLDECADSERQVEVIDVLHGVLAAINAPNHPRVKLVISSRPEPWIRNRILRCERAGKAVSVTLHGKLNPSSDIKVYYDAHFARIREGHPMGPTITPDWPRPRQKKRLMDITDNHFAFAQTAGIFVADSTEDPREQLQIVLGAIPRTFASPHRQLDQLFSGIFSRVPKKRLFQTLRVIGAILVPSRYALDPSPPLLELVFSLKPGEVQHLFFHLESLFDLGNRISSWIRPHYKTLADFLFNASRSKPYGLFIDQRDVYDDLRESVCSVFLRGRRPDRDALAAFHYYLGRLSRGAVKDSRSQWALVPPRLTSRQTIQGGPSPPARQVWVPWAVLLYNTFSQLPILRDLAGPSLHSYVQQIHSIDDSRLDKALRAYESSALGRLCLVLVGPATWQTHDDASATFYRAFIRHAIRSQPELLDLDKTIGWNLLACDLDDLASATISFHSRPNPYISDVVKRVAYETFVPDWSISRLGMLLRWHEAGHKATDDPWEHAACGGSIEVASESQLKCSICAQVLKICQVNVIAICLRSTHPEGSFYQKIFEHACTCPLLWKHLHLFSLWMHVIKENKGVVVSDPGLLKVAVCVQQQLAKLQRACKEKVQQLVLDGWDELDAHYMSYSPYSRACIPLVPSDEYAVRVAKRRAASFQGLERPLEEVVDRFPTTTND